MVADTEPIVNLCEVCGAPCGELHRIQTDQQVMVCEACADRLITSGQGVAT